MVRIMVLLMVFSFLVIIGMHLRMKTQAGFLQNRKQAWDQ